MSQKQKTYLITVFVFTFFTMFAAQAFGAGLSGYPEVKQDKTNWCWAGVSISVLEWYGKSVTQCNFVKKVKGTGSCNNDSASVTEAQNGMYEYGVSANYYNGSLSYSTLKTKIDGNMPIYVSWKWNSSADTGHAVVIYGYNEYTSNGTYYDYVYYMDPWEGVKTFLKYSEFKGGSSYDRTWRWGLSELYKYK
ncbi:papain-like cysteine protease family protein [Paenibacillus sp. SYP-B4298]|uniref:papain-like cysteine protease family protein n=1 Tax=Paenibacillus sp. SYP-B4298 TaxID=2996034 RepID=UPI0022DE3458|nr:papain-like cysteine protease family protein [Paenibacillus sp. SYP-B4298]